MGKRRNNEWDDTTEVYSPAEVEAVLRSLGIEVIDQTENDFISLCPYHGNTDTPAFSTSKRYGYSICFNPACAKGVDVRLTLERMVRELKGMTPIAAKRYIKVHKGDAGESFQDKFDAISLNDQAVQKEFPARAIQRMHERLLDTPAAIEYMHGRGMTMETLKTFKVGFTPAQRAPVYRKHDMVVVPAYDHLARPMGLVGRSIVGKEFKNFGPEPDGTGFHKSKIIWNLQNARRYETVIIAEATFDAMRIHQAGYPNVVALLGGSLSITQAALLSRHFTHAIIFTDNENDENGGTTYHRYCRKCLNEGYDICNGHAPGRDLGISIADKLPRMRISWPMFDLENIYPRNVKDASAMTDDEIRACMRNQVSHFEYLDYVAA